MFNINFILGDRHGDGHLKTRDCILQSNKNAKELREIYFRACEKLGVRLDSHRGSEFPTPCSAYEDNSFPKDLYDHLVGKGVKMPDFVKTKEGNYIVLHYELLDLIIAFIQWEDSSVILQHLESEDFHIYQKDEKGRYIDSIGYGLFTDSD